ncbi:MAG: imidazolonepropionase [Candidatus Brocadiaceae bacterium]|uniref:imidazolonepropionase n=1 Tax=Candidatus Wunengus sp. YC61 TaxID=3367698 RepID=UPI0027229982|nr:imidazolonepropionase [Candidatus Brocadiaceae bacterium]
MNLLPDLFIQNCGQLLTVAGASQRPKILQGMDDLGIILNGAVAIKAGKIIDVGTTGQLEKKYNKKGVKVIDAMGNVVLPGFVDCHTHAVFGGDRTGEFVQRMQGVSYLEILKTGGGILSTVKNTRELTLEKLVEVSKKHLDTMLLHGTTTVEIKSGYGLDNKSELKILKAIQRLKKAHFMDIIPTFLGAHTIPFEYQSDPDAYVDFVCNILPEVKASAIFCDVFCDDGGFTIEQTEKILSTAKKLGFRLKIHINEFKDIGGVPLAIRLCATSADHLDNIKHRDIVKLKKRGIICVLLPGVPFFLMKENYAPGRKMVEEGLPIALATDFNPGTCPCENIQMIITLACLKLGMTSAQAINAVTINAAHAVGMADRIGSIEVGKQADIIILDIQDYNQLPYYFGTNHVKKVLKKGRLIVENKQLVDLR